MKNILVTGGAGFIGSHTVVSLFEAGYKPIILDNFANSDPKVVNQIEKIIKTSVKLYNGDFADNQLLKKIISYEKIDGVIHFAAYKSVGESVQKPLLYYKNNVAGLITLLEVILKSNISSFVFSSSCTVYGQARILPITENEAIKPAESPYGSSKQMGEVITSDATRASERLRSLALRYFNPIGAHNTALIGELPKGVPANLVPFVTQTAAGIRKMLTVFGNDYQTPDGTCIRDYIHVVDLANAHVKALDYLDKQKPKYFDFFNLGTGTGKSVLEVIKSFEKVTGKKIPYTIGPRRKGDITSAYAAVNKANSLLKWYAEKTFDEALIDAWRWQQTLFRKG